MGFIKWLIEQYRIYKAEKYLTPSKPENEKVFINNYYRCVEAGFTTEQINAILNLCCVGDKLVRKENEHDGE